MIFVAATIIAVSAGPVRLERAWSCPLNCMIYPSIDPSVGIAVVADGLYHVNLETGKPTRFLANADLPAKGWQEPGNPLGLRLWTEQGVMGHSRSYRALPDLGPIQVGGKLMELVWDTPKRRIANTDGSTLHELVPGTSKEIASVSAPYSDENMQVVGNPDDAVFAISASKAWAGGEQHVAAVFRKPIDRTVKGLATVYAVHGDRVLGCATLSWGRESSYTRFGPITLFSARTGKRIWQRRDLQSPWANEDVLWAPGAIVVVEPGRLGLRAVILDPRTGKTVGETQVATTPVRTNSVGDLLMVYSRESVQAWRIARDPLRRPHT
jgi:hypothetical protein